MTIKKRFTLNEIAEKANITRYTLYKVIHNKEGVSDETRELALKALKKYNYRPNRNARNLAANRTYTIGFAGLQAENAEYFSEMILKGLARAEARLEDHGLRIIKRVSRLDSPAQQIDDIRELERQNIDGLIVVPNLPEYLENLLGVLSVPVYLLSRYLPSAPALYPYVGCDYRNSGRLAGELMGKMLRNGERYLVLTNSIIKDDFYEQERYRGFLEKMADFPHMESFQIDDEKLIDKTAVYQTIRQLLSRSTVPIRGILDITGHPVVIAKAISDAGAASSVKYICFDLFPSIIEYVKNGVVDFVISQDLKSQGEIIVDMLFEQLCYNNTPAEKGHNIKLEIIGQENLGYFTEI